MMWRLRGLPPYSTAQSSVEAQYFNIIRLAQRRLSAPIRLQLKGLAKVDMIIDHDSWVCVDTTLNDLPIAAWTDFKSEGRDNLHEPIGCTLTYYHFKASAIVKNALEITKELLTHRLATPPSCDINKQKKRHYTSNKRELTVVD